MTRILGIDVGGANLKVADGAGFGRSEPFALWKEPQRLAERLAALVQQAPPAEQLVATMTGELADCFRTKADGVRAIVAALVQAAAGRGVCIYQTDGQFVSAEQAAESPLLAAASNWHALACFAARYVPSGDGLLIDIGSTTTDLIPLQVGEPADVGHTDFERLISGALVYTGVVRSPVCALVDALTWHGVRCGVAQELFATTLDAYLINGDLPEDAADCQTADGRPATIPFAHERLARMLCADAASLTPAALALAAGEVIEAQVTLIAEALERVLGDGAIEPQTIVISGQGEFLARWVCKRIGLEAPIFSLTERLGAALSAVAPAHAVAVLAQERTDG